MTKAPAPSDLADKFMLRMPEGMRERMAAVAKANNRSMNAEIIARLEASLRNDSRGKDPDNVVASVYVLLDTDGFPTSWAEINEHLTALSLARNLDIVKMQVDVLAPNLVGSSERIREARKLAKRYRARQEQRAAVNSDGEVSS